MDIKKRRRNISVPSVFFALGSYLIKKNVRVNIVFLLGMDVYYIISSIVCAFIIVYYIMLFYSYRALEKEVRNQLDYYFLMAIILIILSMVLLFT